MLTKHENKKARALQKNGRVTPPMSKKASITRRLSVGMGAFFLALVNVTRLMDRCKQASGTLSFEGGVGSFLFGRGFGGWPPINKNFHQRLG